MGAFSERLRRRMAADVAAQELPAWPAHRALALTLAGNALTATAGLATAAILASSALAGFRALTSGALGAPPHARKPVTASRLAYNPKFP
jgi:hypothetical protein